MSRDARILKWSLLGGGTYFACVALAHAVGVKIPGLFVYFNVPSHTYQDHIIAFLAFGWATFFYVAADDPATHPLPVRAILLSSTVAILGLAGINATDDLGGSSSGVGVGPFWVQAAFRLAYLVWLFVFYRRSRRSA